MVAAPAQQPANGTSRMIVVYIENAMSLLGFKRATNRALAVLLA